MKQKLDVCDLHEVVVPRAIGPGLHKLKNRLWCEFVDERLPSQLEIENRLARSVL